MDLLNSIITIIYYVIVAYVAVIMIYNFIKSKNWEKEILYIVVLIPILLRLFRFK